MIDIREAQKFIWATAQISSSILARFGEDLTLVISFKGSLLFGDSSVDISEKKKPYRVLNIALLKWGFNKFGEKSIFVICDAYSVYYEIGWDWEDWLFI